MGMFSRIMGKSRPEVTDSKRIYRALMTQSRLPQFFGPARLPDSYEGRIEILTLHVSALMYALGDHGENGKRLSQALFDVMVDDFDTALRGEGLTDSGVKRRIKPIIKLFYARLKVYTEGLHGADLTQAVTSGELKDVPAAFTESLSQYGLNFTQELKSKSLGDLAMAKFSFPKLTKE